MAGGTGWLEQEAHRTVWAPPSETTMNVWARPRAARDGLLAVLLQLSLQRLWTLTAQRRAPTASAVTTRAAAEP